MTLTDRVKFLADVRKARKDLEAKVKRAKELEEIEASLILEELKKMGVTSMNVSGVGRVTASNTTHAEIKNYEALAYHIFNNMRDAAADGLPLSSALGALQKRATRKYFEELAEQGVDIDKAGVELVGKTTLSLTQK